MTTLAMTRRAAFVAPAGLLAACAAPAPRWAPGPAFSLARVQVRDGAAFGEYAAGHVPSLAAAGGSFLAAGAMPRVIEGSWPQRRMVIHQWPDAQAFLDWYSGDAYRPWKAKRHAAADTDVVLVQGSALSARPRSRPRSSSSTWTCRTRPASRSTCRATCPGCARRAGNSSPRAAATR